MDRVGRTLGVVVVVVTTLAMGACSSDGSGGAGVAGEIWVANANSADVRIYDGSTYERLATVAAGRTPQSLAVSPDGSEVWVVDVDGKQILVVDVASRQVTHRIRSQQVVDGPTEVHFSNDGKIAYLTGSGGMVNLIDPSRYKVVAAKPVGVFTYGLWVMPDGTLRTANRESDDITVAARRGRFIDRFPSGQGSFDVVSTSDGSQLFVSARGWNAVSVLNGEDHELRGAIPVGGEPLNLALTPDDQRLFVSNSADSTISMIDATTFELHGVGNTSIGDVLDVGDRVGDCDGCVTPVVQQWEQQPVTGTVTRFAEQGVVLETGDGQRTVPDNVFVGLTGGLRPRGLDVTDDGRHLLVVFNASSDVFVYDATTGEQVKWLHGCESEPAETEPGCNPGAIDVQVVPTT